MKYIALMRHSIKSAHGNAPLGPEGIASAYEIGKTQLRGKQFTHLYVSTLSRTVDTLKALREGAGDFPTQEPAIFPPHVVSGAPYAMVLWEGVCRKAEIAGADMMQAALTHDKERAETIAKEGGKIFEEWIEALPNDSRVLVVHHSPFLELIAYYLFDITLPQLQPCEGFQVIEENGIFTFKNGL